MGVGRELQELGRFLDDCERKTDAVQCFDVAEVTDVGDQRLAADLELIVSLTTDRTDRIELFDPAVGADGTVRFALESTSDLPIDTDHDVAVEPTAAALNGDGTATITLAATVPEAAAQTTPDGSDDAADNTERAEHHGSATASSDHWVSVAGDGDAVAASVDASDTDDATVHATDSSVARDRAADVDEPAADSDYERDVNEPTRPSECDVPPFKDTDLLADVYESCDTFSEMAEAVPMDVTGETIRRYMIEHDIHEPTTYQTSTDDPQPVVLSDGIGLPDGVTVDTLVETVRTSNTIYQVKQDIDVDREDALEMVKELNLLDLVVGRLATEGEREITHDDVVNCLREASAVE